MATASTRIDDNAGTVVKGAFPVQLDVDGVSAAVRDVLAAEPGVFRARLFGSRSRGDNTPWSDYDIAVEIDAPLSRGFGSSAILQDKLVDALGWRVDLVVVDNWRYGDEILRREIERDGVVVYERDCSSEIRTEEVSRSRGDQEGT